jgi:hypothetical protein
MVVALHVCGGWCQGAWLHPEAAGVQPWVGGTMGSPGGSLFVLV